MQSKKIKPFKQSFIDDEPGCSSFLLPSEIKAACSPQFSCHTATKESHSPSQNGQHASEVCSSKKRREASKLLKPEQTQ